MNHLKNPGPFVPFTFVIETKKYKKGANFFTVNLMPHFACHFSFLSALFSDLFLRGMKIFREFNLENAALVLKTKGFGNALRCFTFIKKGGARFTLIHNVTSVIEVAILLFVIPETDETDNPAALLPENGQKNKRKAIRFSPQTFNRLNFPTIKDAIPVEKKCVFTDGACHRMWNHHRGFQISKPSLILGQCVRIPTTKAKTQ